MRKRNIEIQFPWQIELLVSGMSVVISGMVVFIGWWRLEVVNDSFTSMFSSMGTASSAPISLGAVWPLPLIVFSIFSVRLDLAIRRFLAKQLSLL